MQLIQHVALQQLLVRHPHLHRVPARAVLVEPPVDERHVDRPSHPTRLHVKRPRREAQRHAVHRVVRVQRRVRK